MLYDSLGDRYAAKIANGLDGIPSLISAERRRNRDREFEGASSR